MGLESRKTGTYYYRKVRRGDRVVSEYVGAGEAADLLREADRLTRDEAEAARLEEAVRAEEIDDGDRVIREYFDAVEAAVRDALAANGYRRTRGEWRRARGRGRAR